MRDDWLGFYTGRAAGGTAAWSFRRLILNCTRQWGKSTATAAKAVERAHTRAESLTLVLSPTARQSGEFLRKAAGFVTPRGKHGFFWEVWAKGGPKWTRVSVPATECPRIPARFLAEERASIGERWFRQELCEFAEAEDAVFSRKMIEGAATEEVEPLFG